MSSHLEILIQEQLLSLTVEQVCENIIQHLGSADAVSSSEVQTAALFISRSGKPEKFNQLIHVLLENKSDYIPWASIVEFTSNYQQQLKPVYFQFIKEGVLETQQQFDLTCVDSLVNQEISEIHQWHLEKNHKLNKALDEAKAKLLDQLEYFKSQRLFDQEKKILIRLYKMFPNELTIKQLYQENQLRYAEDFLNRRTKSSSNNANLLQKNFNKSETNVEFAKSLVEQSQLHPDLIYELAVSAFIHEEYKAGLEILKEAELTPEMQWLRIELLLASDHYLEVLGVLPEIEKNLAHESETFFATAYYRAQALWGLKQTHLAIEVLEALLDSRPSYRSAQLLLSKWRSS